MRCLLCEALSFEQICLECQSLYLKPRLHKRRLKQDLYCYSFYSYREIKDLLHTKHTDLGYYIYAILAKNSFELFAQEFEHNEQIYALAVDDLPLGGYSHTALLAKALTSSYIKPLYGSLRAKNRISYSGKSREFRLLNPRGFECKNVTNRAVIVVDDIVTTGATLMEASGAIEAKNGKTLFCLTLADASLH